MASKLLHILLHLFLVLQNCLPKTFCTSWNTASGLCSAWESIQSLDHQWWCHRIQPFYVCCRSSFYIWYKTWGSFEDDWACVSDAAVAEAEDEDIVPYQEAREVSGRAQAVGEQSDEGEA